MAIIDEKMHKKIAELVSQALLLEHLLNRTEGIDPEQQVRFSAALTETALRAFAASEDLERERDAGNRLLKQELSMALWRIGLHCMDVHEWTEPDMLQAQLQRIGMCCRSIMSMLDLPEPIWDESPEVPRSETIAVFTKKETELTAVNGEEQEDVPEEESFFLAILSGPREEDQAEKLKREIKELRELLASLVLRRDNLLLVESKELEALYMRELGNLEAEIYREETNARYWQRKYEMMQAAANRQEKADTREIEKKLEEQYEAFKKSYEDFIRKAREAEEAVRKRKDNAKNSSDGIKTEQEKTEQEAGAGKTASAEAEQAEQTGEARHDAGEPEDEIKRLKKLYRKIVKAMHPDLHPNQDEYTKELFKKAIRAYEEGDLRTLEEIAMIIDGEAPESGQDLLTALIEERNRLLALIQSIRAQISLILVRYPFTKKELLNNPEKLKAEKEKLKARLERAKQRAEAYRRRIEEMEKRG